jgi:RNA polymerase sigma factor (sigma-70 family)
VSVTEPTVVTLVAQAREGDKAAWEEIVERYAPLVWRVCRRYRLSDQDAMDVGQNVWLLLVEHLRQLREPAALPGWLARTTQRECLRLLRSDKRQLAVADAQQRQAVTEVDPSTESVVLASERNAALRAAFAELPPDCQQLFALLTQDPPLSYAEIGARMDRAVGGLGPRRARCLEKLRRNSRLAGFLQPDGTLREGGQP